MNTFKKVLSVGVVVATIVWSMGLAAFVPSASAATLAAGALIKASGKAVYYYAADGKRYTFPNEKTYFSWYPDFSRVMTITDNELANIDLAGNVVVRPGTYLVKITTIPKVFAVEPHGMLRHIASEAAAVALYGSTWATKVIDVSDAFWPNYTDLNQQLTGNEYPEGQLVKYAAGADVYYVNGDASWSKIVDAATFYANMFRWEFVVTAPASMSFVAGANIVGAQCQFTDVSQGGGCGVVVPPPPVVGGPLTVSLSGASPAATSIPTNSSSDFVTFKFAAGSKPVTISSLTLTAGGLSDAGNIDAVTLYWDGVKVSTSKDISATSKEATFNFATPLTLAANASKDLVVKATAFAAGVYALGIKTASAIVTDASSVSGTFPIMGANMTAAANSNIGIVTMTNAGYFGTTSNNNFGDDNVLVAAFNLEPSNEAVLWTTAAFRNGGTNAAGIVSNCQMLVDGVNVSAGTYDGTYVNFNLNNFEIKKDDQVGVEVRCDLGVANVANEIKLYIKDRADLAFVGKDYGFGVQLTDASWGLMNASGEGITVVLAAGDVTQDMDKAKTPSKDVKPDTNGVVFATWSIVSNGENATIDTFDNADGTFIVDGTGFTAATALTNIKMRDVATGGVYDLTATYNGGTSNYELAMSDTVQLVKGVKKTFEFIADVGTVAEGAAEGSTFKLVVNKAALTITGDTSSANLTNITPSEVSGSLMTVKGPTLTVNTTALTSKSLVGGAIDIPVYQAQMKAGSVDAVKLQSVMLSSAAGECVFADANISKLDAYLNGVLVKSLAGQIAETTTTAGFGTVTFNSLITTNDANVIPAGATVNFVVKASFSSTFDLGLDNTATCTTATDAFQLDIATVGTEVVARAKTDNSSITPSGTTGVSRLVTLKLNGSLSVDLKTTNDVADESIYLLAGTQTPKDKYLAEIVFTTADEPIKVKTMNLVWGTGADANDQDLSAVKLVKADGTVVLNGSDTPDAAGNVVFDPLDYVFPADQATSLYVVAEARGINVLDDASSTASHAAAYNFKLSTVTAEGANSGVAVTPTVDTTDESNMNIISASVMTAMDKDMGSGVLTGGTGTTIGKYKFTFDNGSNRWTDNSPAKARFGKLVFTVSKSAAVDLYTGSISPTIEVAGSGVTVAADASSTCISAPLTPTCTIIFTEAALDAGLSSANLFDGSVSLELKANVTTTSAEFVKTSFVDLNGVGSNDDLEYSGYNTSAVFKNMFLGFSTKEGAVLSN